MNFMLELDVINKDLQSVKKLLRNNYLCLDRV